MCCRIEELFRSHESPSEMMCRVLIFRSCAGLTFWGIGGVARLSICMQYGVCCEAADLRMLTNPRLAFQVFPLCKTKPRSPVFHKVVKQIKESSESNKPPYTFMLSFLPCLVVVCFPFAVRLLVLWCPWWTCIAWGSRALCGWSTCEDFWQPFQRANWDRGHPFPACSSSTLCFL